MWIALVRLIMGGLLSVAGSLVGRVLLALGFTFVTFTGFNVTIDWLKNQIVSYMGAMPGDVLSFLGWLWVDKAIGVMFSAYAAAVAVKMATGSVLTKMVIKK